MLNFVTVEMNDQQSTCLQSLQETGLYGKTASDVALRLLDAAFREKIREGAIDMPKSAYKKKEG